jgi:heme/copper-type cytochrome/quinol oxidase subunit 3
VNQENKDPRSEKDKREDRKWIIFIFSFPALAVFAGMITLYIAITHPDEVVDKNINRFGLSPAIEKTVINESANRESSTKESE